MRETRTAVLAHHVAAARKRGLAMDGYADAVAELYAARTPAHARCVPFHGHERGSDTYAVLAANAQIVQRFLDGTVRMAADVEESLVLALPEPMRGACLAELAERVGLLAAAQPGEGRAAVTAQVGELASDFGEAMQAIAPMVADGTFNAKDAPYAAQARAALLGLISSATTLLNADARLIHGQRKASA